MNMAKNRIIYAVIVALCVSFSMLSQSTFTAVLLFSVLLYPFFAAIFLAVSLFFADIKFVNEHYIGEKKRPFDIEIEVRNRFILPFVPIEFVCTTPDLDEGILDERRIFATLQPFGKTTLAMNCRHKYRGSYKAVIEKFYIIDPLGILRFSRKLNREMSLIFLPRRFSIEELFARANGETVVSQKTLNNAEKEDFSHVREYHSGDILQLVHWKLTAKSGDLMIKEFESISDRKAKILCDFEGCAAEFDSMMCIDTVIETALAFTKSFLTSNIGATVDYGDIFRKDISVIRSKADFEHFFELMSILPANAKVCDFSTMLSELRAGEQSIILLITPRITEEIVYMANAATSMGTVILAYINLEKAPLWRDFSGERFLLMNICGEDKEALDAAVENLRKSQEQ